MLSFEYELQFDIHWLTFDLSCNPMTFSSNVDLSRQCNAKNVKISVPAISSRLSENIKRTNWK